MNGKSGRIVGRIRAVAFLSAVVGLSCARGPQCRTGTTQLGESCVPENIAAYTQCVHAAGGGTLEIDRGTTLAQEAQYLGAHANSTADLQDKLMEKVNPQAQPNARIILEQCATMATGSATGATAAKGSVRDQAVVGLMGVARERAPGMMKREEWIGELAQGEQRVFRVPLNPGFCIGAVGFSPPGNVDDLALQVVLTTGSMGGAPTLLAASTTNDNSPVIRGEKGKPNCLARGVPPLEGEVRVYARAGSGIAGVWILSADESQL